MKWADGLLVFISDVERLKTGCFLEKHSNEFAVQSRNATLAKGKDNARFANKSRRSATDQILVSTAIFRARVCLPAI